LLLGSWLGLALVPILVILLVTRTVLEERTLAAGLPGYAQYAARVQYRLIPFVW
jgi:protein-S-isoprenylcysteine O-methyltransferase Ste14